MEFVMPPLSKATPFSPYFLASIAAARPGTGPDASPGGATEPGAGGDQEEVVEADYEIVDEEK